MRKQLKHFFTILMLTLISSPLYAMDAYGWVAGVENEFYKKKFAEKTKEYGTEDFDQLNDKKGDVKLKCAQALYLYGGHKALKEAFSAMKKGLVVTSDCDSPDKLGVFFSKVGASGKTKIIIMITPVDENQTKVIGEDYFYQFRIGEDIDKNLTESLLKKQIVGIIDQIK